MSCIMSVKCMSVSVCAVKRNQRSVTKASMIADIYDANRGREQNKQCRSSVATRSHIQITSTSNLKSNMKSTPKNNITSNRENHTPVKWNEVHGLLSGEVAPGSRFWVGDSGGDSICLRWWWAPARQLRKASVGGLGSVSLGHVEGKAAYAGPRVASCAVC